MGVRWLEIAPQRLVDFLKNHSGLERTYTVEYPLPDDARFIDVMYRASGKLDLLLESAEWPGQSEVPLYQPKVTVTLLEVKHEPDA